MADLIAFHKYYSHHSFLSPSTMAPSTNGHSHKRSLSSGARSRSAEKTVTKAKSANDLTRLIADNALPGASTGPENRPQNNFSTIKDPRLSDSPQDSESSSSPSHHPDLNNEVAALSVKLVQAINNQTTLDDDLVAARQDLESAQSRIQALELENGKYRRDVDNQVLVRKVDTDYEISCLKVNLAEERAQRTHIEKGKKTIEQELETLTAALFEEANKMVAAAKLEREAVEKKNEQLRAQVKDTELLLASHQDQLAELKSVMQGLTPGKDDSEVHTNISTTPSSPVVSQRPLPSIRRTIEDTDVPEVTQDSEELLPGPSTSFPQFIKSVCRTDIPAYDDFRDLFTLAASSKPPSRAASGSYGGMNVMTLASLAGHAGGGFGSASPSPSKSQTHSPNGSMSSPQATGSHIPLKETRFYKRIVTEDIDPTLRLDAAPGISWLTRRTVMGCICEGSLIVEPMPASSKRYGFSCSVCGDHRPGTVNERTHRFRTSESETAQRYPLCVLCLEKVRSCCEFTGYLRLILDGHLRVANDTEEKDAWEETIRLRERMFWARVGGGVIPLFSHQNDVDGYRREAASAPSIYSNDQSVQPSLATNGAGMQAVYENDDQESADEHFLSAGSESSDSVVDAPYVLQNREVEGANSPKNEVFEEDPERSTGSVIANQDGLSVSDSGVRSSGTTKREVSEQTTEQSTSSVIDIQNGLFASESEVRSSDTTKLEVSGQIAQQPTSSVVDNENGAHALESNERQNFDSANDVTVEQAPEQSQSSVVFHRNGEARKSTTETTVQRPQQQDAKSENHDP